MVSTLGSLGRLYYFVIQTEGLGQECKGGSTLAPFGADFLEALDQYM